MMTTNEQARADAMADAETLRLYLYSGGPATDRHIRRCDAANAADAVLTDAACHKWGHKPFRHFRVISAIRAAFRAVPGLRG